MPTAAPATGKVWLVGRRRINIMGIAPYSGFRVAPPAVSMQQWAFLAARFRRAVRKQPEIAMLRRRLRAIGGEMLVPAPDDVDGDISELLDKAEVMTGR